MLTSTGWRPGLTWADLHTAMSVDLPTGELTREAVVHTEERVRTDERRLAKTGS